LDANILPDKLDVDVAQFQRIERVIVEVVHARPALIEHEPAVTRQRVQTNSLILLQSQLEMG
jgi:hypothetical protein